MTHCRVHCGEAAKITTQQSKIAAKSRVNKATLEMRRDEASEAKTSL